MSSETVSDGRLDELIAEYGRIAPYVGATNTFRDMMSALTELKSLRAQHEPPAIQSSLARMSGQPTVGPHRYPLAQLLEEICDGCTINQISGEYQIPLESIKAALRQISRNVAEPPAGCAEMAREIVDELIGEVVGDAYGFFSYTNDAIPIIAAKLAPLFTLLKRVPEVFSDRECVLHEGYCPGCTLLADIDAALGKGDADGGQLSQPKESEVQR